MAEENDGEVSYWEERWAKNKMESDDYLKRNFQLKDVWFELTFGSVLGTPDGSPYGKVLDFGCGSAMYSTPLLRRYAKYYGADPSVSAVEIGTKFFWMSNQERIDLRVIKPIREARLPYPNGFFDAVFTCTVLQHQPDWELMVEELKRVMKPCALYFGNEWMHDEWKFRQVWKPYELIKQTNFPDDNIWVTDKVGAV